MAATCFNGAAGMNPRKWRPAEWAAALAARHQAASAERLDRHVRRLRDASPGLEVTRADVVRMLLTKGLDEVEGQAKKRRRS